MFSKQYTFLYVVRLASGHLEIAVDVSYITPEVTNTHTHIHTHYTYTSNKKHQQNEWYKCDANLFKSAAYSKSRTCSTFWRQLMKFFDEICHTKRMLFHCISLLFAQWKTVEPCQHTHIPNSYKRNERENVQEHKIVLY